MPGRLETGPPPDRGKWRVEMVEQKSENGLVLFEYAIREPGKEPFLLNNHKAQLRENHQRIITNRRGDMLHASGVYVPEADIGAFMRTPAAYRWVGADRAGRWLADDGRALPPYMFVAAPWAGGQLEELDPQWQRETFALPIAEQVQERTDLYQNLAEKRRWVGDRRGTTLNLQVGASTDDGFVVVGSSIDKTGTAAYTGAFLSNIYALWARWTGVSGLSGATIDSADYWQNQSSTTGSPLTRVFFEDAAAPSAPSTYADYTSRTETTAFVDWDGGFGATAGTFYRKDVTAIIQELADSYDCSELQVLQKNDGSSGFNYAAAKTYNSSSANAAKLDITYSTGGGGSAKTSRLALLGVN